MFQFLFKTLFHQSLKPNSLLATTAGLGPSPSIQTRNINALNFRGVPKVVKTADEAVAHIRSHDQLFIHGIAAVPHALVAALVRRHSSLRDVEIYHIHTEGPAPYLDHPESFHLTSFFVGHNVRAATQRGDADYIPIFLSEVPSLFAKNRIKLDAALVTVSPPDKHGFCSLGTSVDVSLAALRAANMVVAQVNSHMPRTQGAGIVHINAFDVVYHEDQPLPEPKQPTITPQVLQIARNVAELVPNGACLQMGIGAIPDAVLGQLMSHRNLGIHTEMMANGTLELIDKGVVNGSEKVVFPGKIVTSFSLGSREMYDFLDDNANVFFGESSWVNDPLVIAKNPKTTAINSCLEIDLTGQICADSIGSLIYSGVGGQMDFMRGAAMSEGGKPIIAFPSVTNKGISRIVPTLKPGAGVVTTRSHVHWVATEYGAVNLFGLPIRKRQQALIKIAHPDHREALALAVEEQYKQVRDKSTRTASKVEAE